MQTENKIFAALANAIANRNDNRCVVDFENGETLLVDFSYCGTDILEDKDVVCIWSLQRDINDADGNLIDTKEIDCGSFTQYVNVYDFVVKMLAQYNGNIYVDSF